LMLSFGFIFLSWRICTSVSNTHLNLCGTHLLYI